MPSITIPPKKCHWVPLLGPPDVLKLEVRGDLPHDVFVLDNENFLAFQAKRPHVPRLGSMGHFTHESLLRLSPRESWFMAIGNPNDKPLRLDYKFWIPAPNPRAPF